MATPEYTTNAKQVLRDNLHLADAVSEEVAQQIVDALNIPDWLDAEADRLNASRPTARAWRVAADNIRAGFHGEKE